MSENKYFIILGKKIIKYDTVEEAMAAVERFKPIYRCDIPLYEGKLIML